MLKDIRLHSDHMDTLRLYNGYKHYWDKHRIPGEMVRNEQLWEDPWWKQKKLMQLQTRGGTRSLPPLQSRRLKRRVLASATSSANSSSTIRTSKSLPAKMAATDAKQHNGTQTDDQSMSNSVKLLTKSLVAENNKKHSSSNSLPLIPPTTPNNSEKLSDTASVSSNTDTKLPPVVTKEQAA